MTRVVFLLLAYVALTPGQSGIGPPLVGLVRDSGGNLRPVLGVAGSFITGNILSTQVESVSFSGDLGFVKTTESIKVFDVSGGLISEQTAPPGPALFAISPAGREAVAFLTATGEWWRWSRGEFRPFEVEPGLAGAEVLSLAMPARDRLSFVLRTGGATSLSELSLRTGRVHAGPPLDGVSAPLLLRADGTLLFTSAGELVLRSAGGEQRRIGLNCAPAGIAEMGRGWIHVASECGQFALRLSGGADEIYRLPEVTP
jgi:hypothetical protein